MDNLSGIIDWRNKRAGVRLKQLNHNPEFMDIIISSVNQIDNLCLEIITPKRFEPLAGLTRLEEGIYHLMLPQIGKGDYHLRLALRND